MNLTVRKRDEKGRYLPAIPAEPKRKAIVKYRRTADGQNKIVALEGFLSDYEIDGIGDEVSRIWRNSEHRMWRTSPSCVYCQEYGNIYVSHIFTDAEFSALINKMKACGKALSRIIKDVRAADLNEVRVIEI